MAVQGPPAHVDLSVSDPDRAIPFYAALFQALGYERRRIASPEFQGPAPRRACWRVGAPGGASFEVDLRPSSGSDAGRRHDRSAPGLHHLALHAASRADVDRVHRALVAAGAQVLDEPADYTGRSGYSPGYYAAFYADPDGVKLEVAFIPEENPGGSEASMRRFDARLVLENLLFTVAVPGTVAVGVPLLCFEASPGNGPAGLRFAGLCLLAWGAAIYLWCLWDFASFGRGTPAPVDAPRRLVIRGLYRWVRNPMYVGVLSVILGWSALLRSAALLVYAGAVALAFHAFIVLYEEPTLERRFGGEYRRYRSAVGRWWPRLRSPSDVAAD